MWMPSFVLHSKMGVSTSSTGLSCITSATIVLFSLSTVTARLEISVTAPVNPVRVNGVVSIHCQIRDLPPGHEVTLSRRKGALIERLSWNNDLQTTVEERVFLAVRQLNDGSMVYFLTLTHVVKEDKGDYFCTVLTSNNLTNVAEASVSVAVQYFPSDHYPICSTTSSLTVMEGTEMVLSCYSEAATPTVSVRWSQTDGGDLQSVNHKKGGNVFSEYRFRPSRADDNKLFLCTVTSTAFPLLTSSCHIGPLVVTRDPSRPTSVPDSVSNNEANLLTMATDVIGKIPSVASSDIDNRNKSGMITCANKCSSSDMNVIFWVICTIVASFCACVFLMIGIALVAKTRTLPQYAHPPVDARTKEETTRHQMYVQLQKRQDNKTDLYMDLARIDMDNTENRMMFVRKPTEQTCNDVTNRPTV